MEPTLKNGQILWIEKLSTGFQLPGLDFPFGRLTKTGKMPDFGWKIPDRGSIIIFNYPGSGKGYYIKRVIALPGDHIRISSHALYLNGKLLAEPYLKNGTRTGKIPDIYQPPLYRFPQELELLDPEVKYSAMNGAGSNSRVPPHTVFVLGDNRQKSRDSRSIGFIPVFFIRGIVISIQ